jgi:DNA (cytosine-5)-methyltransferase 1
LDLFSGAGGFTLGLEAAGFVSCGAVDIDQVAGETYEQNFGRRPIHLFGPAGDLRKVSPRSVRVALRKAGVTELDVLVAAPPCQGFSRIGRGKLDWMADVEGAFVFDPRNHLYRRAIAFLEELQPRVFLFENVSGILHVRGRNVAEDVCRAVEAQGYRVKAALLNCAWYGVPQTRERVFIIGIRKDLGVEPRFPARECVVRMVPRGHLSEADLDDRIWRNPDYFLPFDSVSKAPRLRPAVTVRQALADLPSFTEHLRALRHGWKYRPRRESMPAVPYASAPRTAFTRAMRGWPGLPAPAAVSDHYCRWTPRDFGTFARMKPDDRYTAAIRIATERYRRAVELARRDNKRPPLRRDFIPPYPADCFDEKWRKLKPDDPAHTITAHLAKDTYSHIHFDPRQARAITIREAARLQTFPDGFSFAGNMGDMFQQIGNAVPPLLARAIGQSIRSVLESVRRTNNGRGPTTLQRSAG